MAAVIMRTRFSAAETAAAFPWEKTMRLRVSVLLLLLAGFGGTAAAEEFPKPLRFGLTAVVVKENLRFLDRWAEYISDKVGRPVEFVRRRSYREIMNMMSSEDLDFAWICGYPFVQKRDPEFLELLVVPVFDGKPLYQSYIIVHADSPNHDFDQLRNKVFAYSDPESNSGFLFPQTLLMKRRETSKTFFRETFFTFNHADTIEAVAEGVADGGAVDSYIWEYMKVFRPEITSQTRVIEMSPAFGFPPLVSRAGVDPRVVSRMRDVFVDMANDPRGQKFLEGLMLDRFATDTAKLYESIRRMAEKVGPAPPWLTGMEKK